MNSLACASLEAADRPVHVPYCRRFFVRALASLTRGRLFLELPEGGRLALGARDPVGESARHEAVLRVLNTAFFRRCALYGDIGFAESYIDGEWETPDLVALISWFILNADQAPTLSGSPGRHAGLNLLRALNRFGHLLRNNTRLRASKNIREHYDLSNEFFALWLDPAMMYSAARWTMPGLTLEQAQYEKNEELCRKLRLGSADHVLEIGSGWGGWSIHAAARYGCRVTSVTLSPAQADLARRRVAEAGLSHLVEIRVHDYRDIPRGASYDKIVSIEMLEAVGHEHLPDWCEVVSRVLKPDGLMALQFITCPDARYAELRRGVDFVQKHIFPGSLLLSLNRLNQLLAGCGGFVLHALDDLGADYARTLGHWRGTFNQRLVEVGALGFDSRFVRKWNYYLAYCEAAFAMRHISVVQTLHTRAGNSALGLRRTSQP
jgi:cyclopropane-fatty-acyl-phospholipid synthase